MAQNVPILVGFRRLFYAITPNESSYENVENVPACVDQSSPFFLTLFILETIWSLWQKDKKIRINDGVTSVMAGILSRIPRIFSGFITLTTYVWMYDKFNIIKLPWNSPWTWWLCFLGVDFGYYWFHRLAHEINFLWAAHQVHHSSEDYNLSTALRQSILQEYTSWVFYLPLALVVPPSIFLIHIQLNLLYQFWIHTQYIKSLGPLEYILNTPSHHRVHHGRNPYCIDKNYAGTLIIWDRIFGTFVAEDEEVVYGLTHPLNTFQPMEVQFGYVDFLWTRVKENEGLWNKLCVLIKGPGWEPGKPRLGNIEDIPKVTAPVPRYDPLIPVWCHVYAVVHFVALTFTNHVIMINLDTTFKPFVVLSFAYVIYSMTCLAHIIEGRRTAPYLEIARCCLYLYLDIVMRRYNKEALADHPEMVYFATIGQALFALSAATWLVVIFRVRFRYFSDEKAKVT